MLDRTIPENPPAFPDSVAVDHMDGLNYSRHSGMTLRDYFAAAALSSTAQLDWVPEQMAVFAYGVADAMLRVRSKGGK